MLQCTELILAFVFLLEWQAHSNAVFDLAWVPGEHRIVSNLLPSDFFFMLWQLCTENDLSFLFFPLKVTASGDQTAKVWDVRAGELLGICKGHQCSLKSVAFSRFEKGKC